MKLKLIISILVIAAIGCTPNPRYRGGGSEMPAQAKSGPSNRSTNSTMKLGRILQSYLGKPYAGSSSYDPGLDCSLFTGEVFKKFARMQLPRTAEEQYKYGQQVQRGNLQFGDLVFFHTNGKRISHVGIYVGHNEFIHASSSNGVMISQLGEKYWSKRFIGAKNILD